MKRLSTVETANLKMYWYNGELVASKTLKLEMNDPGLLYGATVFTTLRVYQQSLQHPLTHWKGHCDRLWHSIQTFGWQPPDWQRLRQGAQALIPDSPVLRIALFPDGREWITGRSLPLDLEQRQQEGIAAWVADAPQFRRWMPTHKTGNYLPAWLALQAAQPPGAKEAILVDLQGHWLETSTGNLWGWREGGWWTPPLDAGILPGLMRSRLLSGLRGKNRTVIEQPWSAEVVSGFEAIAYTNSVVEVVPIHTVVATARSSSDGANALHYNPNHPSLKQLRELLALNSPRLKRAGLP